MAHSAFREGQRVQVKDTANDRLREGTVISVNGNKVEVFVDRFQRVFVFVRGETNLGRFTLEGWS